MGIRKYKPTSPGRRHGSVLDWSELTDRGRTKPMKSLLMPLHRAWGRNHQGKITSRFRGGGVKRLYRIIDFKRRKDDMAATVKSIEYDPNRSANIALIEFEDGELRYVLHPRDLKVGDTVMSGEKVEPKIGNCMPLRSIPEGLDIHNIEMNIGQGGKLVRSAGTSAELASKEGKFAIIQMPSGEFRKIHIECRATIGHIGNHDHQNVVIGKAGRNRHKGWRPRNRGTSMNPVQHPMGGGNKRAGGGRHPCSRTGLLSKGGKTRNPRKPSNQLIIRGRRRGSHVGGGK